MKFIKGLPGGDDYWTQVFKRYTSEYESLFCDDWSIAERGQILHRVNNVIYVVF